MPTTNRRRIETRLELEHLKFWFASPEPVYFALYIEAKDLFLVEDVRSIVHRHWGEEFLSLGTFAPDQKP